MVFSICRPQAAGPPCRNWPGGFRCVTLCGGRLRWAADQGHRSVGAGHRMAVCSSPLARGAQLSWRAAVVHFTDQQRTAGGRQQPDPIGQGQGSRFPIDALPDQHGLPDRRKAGLQATGRRPGYPHEIARRLLSTVAAPERGHHRHPAHIRLLHRLVCSCSRLRPGRRRA